MTRAEILKSTWFRGIVEQAYTQGIFDMLFEKHDAKDTKRYAREYADMAIRELQRPDGIEQTRGVDKIIAAESEKAEEAEG